MKREQLQTLSFKEIQTALRLDSTQLLRHELRRECLRRSEQCSTILHYSGLIIVACTTLVLLYAVAR